MRHFFFFLLVLLCVSCNEQYNCEEPLNDIDSCELAKTRLEAILHGTPLVVPLYTSAPPTLFLIPISDNKNKLSVNRLYLLEYDNTRDFERNLYKIDKIVRRIVDDETRNIAIVSNIMDGTPNEFEIDNFLMHQIRKLNEDKFEY